jgi:hypothetical protein
MSSPFARDRFPRWVLQLALIGAACEIAAILMTLR